MKHEFPILRNMFSSYLNEDLYFEFNSPDKAILVAAEHLEEVGRKAALIELNKILELSLEEKDLRVLILNGLGSCYFYPIEWESGAVWLRHLAFLLKAEDE